MNTKEPTPSDQRCGARIEVLLKEGALARAERDRDLAAEVFDLALLISLGLAR